METFVGYVARVTEYESGWGSRHDGYLVCEDKNAGIRKATAVNGNLVCGDYSCFSKADEFSMCKLNPTGIQEIRSRGCVWTDDIKPYVLEM